MRFNNVRLTNQYDEGYSRNVLCALNLISTFYYEYANYQLHVRKYFGFKIVNINGRETTKDQTLCKICVNDVSYQDRQYANPSSTKTWDYLKFWKFPVDTAKLLRLKDWRIFCPFCGTYYDQCQLRVSDTMLPKNPLSFNSRIRRTQEYYKSICRIHCKGHIALLP